MSFWRNVPADDGAGEPEETALGDALYVVLVDDNCCYVEVH